METQEQLLPTEVRNNLTYLLIVIHITAAVLSVLVVASLLIPLSILLRDGSYRYHERSQRRRSTDAPPYSTYNLYLVYLAIVDLIFLLPLIVAELMTANQKFHPQFRIDLFNVDQPPVEIPSVIGMFSSPYGAANMWMNVVIAYQILTLLRRSQNAQRVTQPSLRRVNIQGASVILGSILYGLLNYYYLIHWWFGQTVYLALVFTFAFIPFFYVIGVTILVKCRGYMKPMASESLRMNESTRRDRSVRGLALYFFRICLVFVLIWLPSYMLVYAVVKGIWPGFASYVAHFLMAIQPIVTFCMILTKPDVKKYVRDLVTLSYCRKRTAVLGGGNRNTRDSNGSNRKTRSTNSLVQGYNFAEPPTDLDAQRDAAYQASTVFCPIEPDESKNTKKTSTLGSAFLSDFDVEQDACGDSVDVAVTEAVNDNDDDSHIDETGTREYESLPSGGPDGTMTAGEAVSVDAQVKKPVAVMALDIDDDTNMDIEKLT